MRFMVINTNWDRETNTVSLESIKNQLIDGLPFIAVSQSNEQESIGLGKNVILPLSLHFDYSEGEEEIESLLWIFLKKLAANQHEKNQVLFLLHRGQGLNKLRQGFSKKLESDLSIQIKDFSFSGGRGAIYGNGENGILHPTGSGFAKGAIDGQIRSFNDVSNPNQIRQKCFENVWNAYWLQTRKKIESIRRKFMYSQIPGYPLEEEKRLEKEFQFVLDAFQMNENPGYEFIGSNKDFANVKDLSVKLGQLKDKNLWIKELKNWLENKQTANMDILNLGLLNLIQIWNEE